ncbi:MAG: hypothetical protein ACE5JX_05875 [Acidobacteriota bacterium]
MSSISRSAGAQIAHGRRERCCGRIRCHRDDGCVSWMQRLECGGRCLLIWRELLALALRIKGLRAGRLLAQCCHERLSQCIPVVRKSHSSRELRGILPAIREDDELTLGGEGWLREVAQEPV